MSNMIRINDDKNNAEKYNSKNTFLKGWSLVDAAISFTNFSKNGSKNAYFRDPQKRSVIFSHYQIAYFKLKITCEWGIYLNDFG